MDVNVPLHCGNNNLQLNLKLIVMKKLFLEELSLTMQATPREMGSQ